MALRAYYNEIDPFACEWLRLLMEAGAIAPGEIDSRSIKDVSAADLAGYGECHFFAGIGGWPIALQIAGWPKDRPVWTGSCPCQPFSSAGKRKGKADDRHLWPEMYRLISKCKPAIVFGEQVASKDGLGWLDGVFADLEESRYACGASDLCAAGVEAPHIRQRLYWLADAGHNLRPRTRQGRRMEAAKRSKSSVNAESGGVAIGLGVTGGSECERREQVPEQPRRQVPDANGTGGTNRLGNAERDGLRSDGRPNAVMPEQPGHWSLFNIIPCRDGKSRRISAEPGDEPLAYGVPQKTGPLLARLELLGVDAKAAKRIIAIARRNRVGRLRGYGNAIVPELAAEFVRAFMETKETGCSYA